MGTPKQISEVLKALEAEGADPKELAGHYHDTYGMATANVLRSMEVRAFLSQKGREPRRHYWDTTAGCASASTHGVSLTNSETVSNAITDISYMTGSARFSTVSRHSTHPPPALGAAPTPRARRGI